MTDISRLIEQGRYNQAYEILSTSSYQPDLVRLALVCYYTGRWDQGLEALKQYWAWAWRHDPVRVTDGAILKLLEKYGTDWEGLVYEPVDPPVKDYEPLIAGLDPAQLEPLSAMLQRPLSRELRRKLERHKAKLMTARRRQVLPPLEVLVSNYQHPRQPRPITMTMTSCKRYHLFEQTVDSFLHHCQDLDLVERWICVDDNSSATDRARMQERYPFIEYIFKGPHEKGHVESLNRLRQLVTTPYLFHLEDDFLFVESQPYLHACLDGFTLGCPQGSTFWTQDNGTLDRTRPDLINPRIGQVLVNRNSAETERDFDLAGSLPIYHRGRRYTLHQYYEPGSEALQTIQSRCCSNAHWPHYSLRPHLLRTEVWAELGPYHDVKGFEHEYAERYRQKYLSVFLGSISCLHIGRLTRSQGADEAVAEENAYQLNGVTQW